ncbi:pyridine nucleotide-disulfide oxidoreductase [Longimonas halophila]|uniref:Pyridine nucleotide-disulfide oxidoreductase n=1 Tax=Longimonas halophila TaxID=1469170 RepID=A0A2H3NQW1_9BACT|nr:FAD/NAD(P)-binding oxidoreductase [Longimonas halophila]PEN09462.1 pyridine nucleotide-disulfide oxidoreductase [Longimonas halophila]
MSTSSQYDVVIVGGGTAGITVAAQLQQSDRAPESIAIIEPSDTHYYQPIWTLVGAGVFDKEISERPMADYIPEGATWLQDAAASFDPEANTVTTKGGDTVAYNYLVVAPGLQLDWDAVPGLAESIDDPNSGVVSNYAYEYCEDTWDVMQQLKPGDNAVFTQPATPIKCGGAPQKIMYLTADHLRREGILDDVSVQFYTPGTVIFGVEKFARTLRKVVDRYGIDVNLHSELVEVRSASNEAVFRATGGDSAPSERVVPYDMLHVTPPQSAPDFIKESPLSNEDGWVDVDKYTLQHTTYENVFSLGDAGSTPNAKTGAAVRKQAPTVVENLLQLMHDGEITAPKEYNGYASCPLVTGYGKLVLAEFDYNNEPDPSFSFDTSQERYSMYALKAYGLPQMYWHGMLRGRA